MTLGSGSSCLGPHPVWRSASCACDLNRGNEENIIIISDTELFSKCWPDLSCGPGAGVTSSQRPRKPRT